MSNLAATPFYRALYAAISAGVPVFGWAKPGIGKSAIMVDSSAFYGRHIEVVNGSNRDQTDFLGLPYQASASSVVSYAPFGWAQRLCDAEGGTLFLDEFNLSSSSVMKAMLRVIQERWVGELNLPDSVSIVAVGNPVEQSQDANELSAPTANRFLHLDWAFDANTWLEGLAGNFADMAYPALPEILGSGTGDDFSWAVGVVSGFLNTRANLVAPNPPVSLGAVSESKSYAASYAYPSPRSWHNLCKVLSWVRRDDAEAQFLVANGLVGEGVGTELFTWLNANDLYDPREVLEGRVQVNWRNRPDRLFALTQALVAMVNQSGNVTELNTALGVLSGAVDAGRKDVVVPAVRAMVKRPVRGLQMPQKLRDGLSDVVLR